MRREIKDELGDTIGGFFDKVATRGSILTQTVTNARTTIRLLVGNAEGSGVEDLTVKRKDELASRVDGAPLGLLRWSLNLEKSWEQAQAEPEAKKQLDELNRITRDEWGIDLEQDIYRNLDGNFSAVMLSGTLPSDAYGVAWVGVKDEAKAVTLLDSLNTKLKANGITLSTDTTPDEHWYSYKKGSLGISRNHLIAVVGDNHLAEVRKALSSGSASFLSRLPKEVQKEAENGPPVYSYVDMTALAAWEKDLPYFKDSDFQTLSRAVAGYSFSAEVQKKDLVQFELSAIAPPGGFSQVLSEELIRQAREKQLKAQRAEMLANIDGIKTAELAYEASFDHYVACGSVQEARARATASELYTFDISAGWSTLGWMPDGQVRAGYYVEVSRSWAGSTFTVHALMDLDHDGVFAEAIATQWRNSTLMTPSNVY
jgi:hypothetical protein